jgi:hypothetical protein
LTAAVTICYRAFVSATVTLIVRTRLNAATPAAWRRSYRWSWLVVWLGMTYASGPLAHAIVVDPTPVQVESALQRGRAAADARTPPDRLYAWFGAADELAPRGFLMTKMAGLTVMSTHFALRSQTPGEPDIRQILEDEHLLISAMIFGGDPRFAVDSYMVLMQGGRTIKPVRVRFDGMAARTSVWPRSPAYRAKVVATFAYAEIDPQAKTVLAVFPGQGGELQFELDFSTIE